MKLNQSGQSLVAVLVSVAISGIVLVAIMQMNSDQAKSLKYFMQKSDLIELKNYTTQQMNQADVCAWNFVAAGARVNDLVPADTTVNFTALRVRADATSPIFLDTTTINFSGGLKLSAIKFQDVTRISNSLYSGYLVISFDASTWVRPLAPLKIRQVVSVNPTGGTSGSRPVTGCQASSSDFNFLATPIQVVAETSPSPQWDNWSALPNPSFPWNPAIPNMGVDLGVGNWRTFDTSIVVPAGANSVILDVRMVNNWRVGGVMALYRKNPTSQTYVLGLSLDNDSQGAQFTQRIMPIDPTTRTFQYRLIRNGDGGNAVINVVGYF